MAAGASPKLNCSIAGLSMSEAHDWPVPVSAVGSVAVGSMLWTTNQLWQLTIFIKSAFRFDLDGTIRWVQAAPLRTKDAHIDGHPMRSLAAVCETAPMLRAADVILSGYGYPDVRKNRATVRLAITRRGKCLLDKSVLVCGARERSDSEPEPFERMALVWENALGGFGFGANPVGTGASSMSAAPPTLLHPAKPDSVPAGFGPVPANWPQRSQRLRGASRRNVHRLQAKLPENMDFKYFQCAPVDQWLDEIHGDEAVLLAGMHPTQPQMSFTMPVVRAVARVFGHEQAGLPEMIWLRADLLQIDAEERLCTIIWRGSVPVADYEAAKTATIVGALEQPGERICWPEPRLRHVARPSSGELGADDHGRPLDTTEQIESRQVESARGSWPPHDVETTEPGEMFEQTGELDPSHVRDSDAALPFRNPGPKEGS